MLLLIVFSPTNKVNGLKLTTTKRFIIKNLLTLTSRRRGRGRMRGLLWECIAIISLLWRIIILGRNWGSGGTLFGFKLIIIRWRRPDIKEMPLRMFMRNNHQQNQRKRRKKSQFQGCNTNLCNLQNKYLLTLETDTKETFRQLLIGPDCPLITKVRPRE